MEGSDGEFAKFTVPTLKAFLKVSSQSVSGNKQELVARAIGWQKTKIILCTCTLLVSQTTMQRHLFSIQHHLFPIMLANATVVAFVLHRNSRFNFHCYTQREAMSTQKWAQKWQLRPFVTSCVKDYEGHLLIQTSFTKLPNRYMHCTQRKVYSVNQYFMYVHSKVILDPPSPPSPPPNCFENNNKIIY